MKIIQIKIEKLKEYENNPRINDNAVESVANSIKEFGFKVPIIVDKNNVIVAGHTRVKAAVALGLSEVPCIVADDLTEEQIKTFRLADNKTAELADWDLVKLGREVEELMNCDINLSDFGFDEKELNYAMEVNQEVIQDEPPGLDFENEPIVNPGEIWQLGNHRLFCGDCTDFQQVGKLLIGVLVDCVITDPPYNMAYEGAGGTTPEKRIKNRIKNDKMSDSDFEKFLIKVYRNLKLSMKDGASFYVFYKELGAGSFITCLKPAGLTFKQELVWVKNQLVLGGQKYQNMYEPCLFGCKGKQIKSWYADRKERSVIESVDLMSEPELRIAIKELLDTDTTDVIRENKPLKNDLHPTMKPIKLLAKFIKNSTKVSDTVLDFFGGSGSTLIACEQLGRNCYMMELDPRYCDVIIKRWENLTGKKAVKL